MTIKSCYATSIACRPGSIQASKCFDSSPSSVPFPHRTISGLFSKDLFDALYNSIAYYLSLETSKAILSKRWNQAVSVASRKGKDPALTYRVSEFHKLGISPIFGYALLKEFSAITQDLLAHYECKRLAQRYYPQAFFSFTPPNFSFRVHDDTPSKCWTLAYNIYPTSNKGTMLYDASKTLVKTCDYRNCILTLIKKFLAQL